MKALRALLIAAAFLTASLCAPARDEAKLVDGIRVVVHDSVITEYEVLVPTMEALKTLSRQYRGEELEKKVAQVDHDNLDELVNRKLILHEFQTAGYNLPESVIDELVHTRIRERFGNEITATRTLQAEGITKEKYRQQIRDTFIVRALREKNVASEIIISPHKIQTYYEQHTNDFKESDKVKLRMIMLNKPVEDDAAQVRQKAEEILSKLKEGATFAEMASVYSQDSYSKQGGEHGWVEQKVLGKELAAAAAALKPGQNSDVIETKGACWLIQMEEKTPAHTKPLSEVRDEIEKNLKLDELKRLDNQWIERLKKKTYIKTF